MEVRGRTEGTMKVAPMFECLVQMKAPLFQADCHIQLIFLESRLSYSIMVENKTVIIHKTNCSFFVGFCVGIRLS